LVVYLEIVQTVPHDQSSSSSSTIEEHPKVKAASFLVVHVQCFHGYERMFHRKVNKVVHLDSMGLMIGLDMFGY
jgi:hypothetical protein